ncbi:hypothetical protein ZOSMA_25G01480 [Zostera marina]|uniref:Uncharacterized protein n=1 Tax=Zostera marina TaxID=29655 RepID=A0A0K9PHP8_ZOSMR|nr:hypothetical protein ZOSMA_25G01480 [Zostera marina]
MYSNQATVQPAAMLSSASSLTETVQKLQQVSIQSEEPTPAKHIASTNHMRFPPRPCKGSSGTKCMVKANHFMAELPKKDLHQYDYARRKFPFYCFEFNEPINRRLELIGTGSIKAASPFSFIRVTYFIKVANN